MDEDRWLKISPFLNALYLIRFNECTQEGKSMGEHLALMNTLQNKISKRNGPMTSIEQWIRWFTLC